jgi:hypothetical protein
MKLEQGENTFRVLSSAIVGYEYWTEDNKPLRAKEPFKSTPNIRKDSKVKHFWAFIVWNYKAEAVQIIEITQSTIQGAIKAIVDNKKWGDPKNYDITITRVGEGFDTEYSIMPNPHTELPDEIKLKYGAKKINLNALYTGDNPFEDVKQDINVDDIQLD